ncbi:MAG: LysR family transcriptional regulator [Deltaproteobacteria bacterium]|nr:LysR family transcriptional regulator [Deltaproteobacteria bacterium]MDQ3300903.1 LysR family transcriptional regulator [Myxococcota bacterium]
MERLHSLYQHWSWLPHFRAIAETEHLGAAAKLLHVTPPALSRALARLEAALGTKLFHRRGRNLVLNEAGAALLRAVRTAMRQIDDSVQDVTPAGQTVHLKVAAPGPYSAVLLPAIARARAKWPKLRLELMAAPEAIVPALVRGDIDVCLHEHAIASSELAIETLAEVQKAVTCAATHPAARRRNLTVADLLAFEFACPPSSPDGVREDGWPPEIPRTVGITVANMQLGVDAAASGQFLAVIPLPVAIGNRLRAVAVRGLTIPPTRVYASTRVPVSSTSDAATRFVGLVRQQFAMLTNR